MGKHHSVVTGEIRDVAPGLWIWRVEYPVHDRAQFERALGREPWTG